MVTYFAPLLKSVHFVISKRNKIELASLQEPFGLRIIFVYEGSVFSNFFLLDYTLQKNNIDQYIRRQVREGKFCTPSKRGNPVYSTSASQYYWEGIYVIALVRRICLLNLLRRICMSALLRRRHQVSPESRFSTTLGIHSLQSRKCSFFNLFTFANTFHDNIIVDIVWSICLCHSVALYVALRATLHLLMTKKHFDIFVASESEARNHAS